VAVNMAMPPSTFLGGGCQLGSQDPRAAICHAILEEHGAHVDLSLLGYFVFRGPMVADDVITGQNKQAKKEYNKLCLELKPPPLPSPQQ